MSNELSPSGVLALVVQECEHAAEGVNAIFVPSNGATVRVRGEEVPPDDIFIGSTSGAVACRSRWAPEQDKPYQECWTVSAVSRRTAGYVLVGPYDDEWCEIDSANWPWFVAATIGGVRGSIERDEPLVSKRATDARLFNRVGEGEAPPRDEHGRI